MKIITNIKNKILLCVFGIKPKLKDNFLQKSPQYHTVYPDDNLTGEDRQKYFENLKKQMTQ